jgi:DNA replication protein DnaC
MMTQATIDKLRALKLFALADALQRQLGSSQYAALSFEERLGLLVDTECTAREQQALARRLRSARLRYPASLENVDFQTPRGLNRQVILSLGTGAWIRARENVALTGPAGIGKSYLASACVESACRHGFTAVYLRTPRVLHDLAVSRADGSYGRLLARLAKVDLLALDDWLLAPLTDAERRDLLEVIEDRSERGSTLVAGQLAIDAWHQAIGEPTLADAICDRLLHHAHRIELKGPSMRDPTP